MSNVCVLAVIEERLGRVLIEVQYALAENPITEEQRKNLALTLKNAIRPAFNAWVEKYENGEV